MNTNPSVGAPRQRIDGRSKVTGQAKYAGDFREPGLLHAVIFGSTIPSGTIASFDLREARAIPGVIEILTHENAPKIKSPMKSLVSSAGESFSPLQTNEVFYNGQHIGCVIAETLEAAHEGARRVKVSYHVTPAKLHFEANLADGHDPGWVNAEKLTKRRGVGARALDDSEVKVEGVYSTPTENHNPIEPSATLASFKGETLLVYDSVQGVATAADHYAHILKLKDKNVTTITKFVGGGFGCKGSFWPHQAIAAMATVKTKRPVKLALTREQMFSGVGYRAKCIQTVSLGANRQGELKAIKHTSVNPTAVNKDFTEACTSATPMLYKCENVETKQSLVPVNYMVPTYMRGPGHSTGSFALESAMDELAIALKMDPIELRLKNYAETDPDLDKPFTSKSLRQCYEQGAAKFGWKDRPKEPRSRRNGDWMIGYGMATATYPARRFTAKASVKLGVNGKAEVRSATQDIGTGTYTIMTQIAADGLGLKFENVDFDLGNNHYPEASVSGGSTGAATVGSAIKLACDDVIEQLKKIAIRDEKSKLHGLKADDLSAGDDRLRSTSGVFEPIAEIVTRHGKAIEAEGKVGLFDMIKGLKFSDSGHSFGAQFAEVRVHVMTGEVRLNRLSGAFAAGKILNPLTARSQYEGGMIYGIGMALLEETNEDIRNGRLAVKDLADYHVPVQADVPPLDVLMIDEKDDKINPLGAKGIGEIGTTGVAAAIANAVYNATGVRVRDLPITPDKLTRA